MSNFQDFGLLNGYYIGSSRLTSEQGHLPKEITFVQDSHGAGLTVLRYLHLDPAVMEDKHRGACVAGANYSLAWGEDMADRRLRQRCRLFDRKRREDIDGREAFNQRAMIRFGGEVFRPTFDLNRAGGEVELHAGAAERIPDSLPNQRIRVVVARIVIEPILNFVFDTALAQISNAYNRRDFFRDVIRLANRFPHDVNRFGW